jgi:hypothetical protein
MAAIQIHDEYKVGDRMRHHDWQEMVGQLKQTAQKEACKGGV